MDAKGDTMSERVIPPRQGLIGVLAVSSGVASDATEIGTTGQHLFICDVDFYITFGDASMVAPDETAVTGNARCMMWPAKTPLPVFISGHNDGHFRAKPTANGHVRWYKG